MIELNEIQQPQPLKGPLGFRELFFSQRRNSLIRYFGVSLLEKILLGFVAALLLFLSGWNFHEISGSDLDDLLWIWFWIAVLSSELVPIFFGYFLIRRQIGSWIQRQRLPELVLSELRPIEIGQCALAATTRAYNILILVLFGGLTVELLAFFPNLPGTCGYFLLLLAFAALNSVVNFYAFSWIALPHSIAFGWFRCGVMYFAVVSVYLIFLLQLFFCVLAVIIVGSEFRFFDPVHFEGFILLAAILLFVIGWSFKYYFAKAYAARLEQVLFPRLSF